MSETATTDDVPVTDPRCGYPKKNGAPCRNRVPAEGKICRVHQKPALLDRILKRTRTVSPPPAEGP